MRDGCGVGPAAHRVRAEGPWEARPAPRVTHVRSFHTLDAPDTQALTVVSTAGDSGEGVVQVHRRTGTHQAHAHTLRQGV